VLGDNVAIGQTVHCVIWLIAVGLLAVCVCGTTQRRIGLRLEEFFLSKNQASVWAQQRTESMASWSAAINWGTLNVWFRHDVWNKLIMCIFSVWCPHENDQAV
jgi:hypothetical protein